MKNEFKNVLLTILLLTVHNFANGQSPDTLTLDYCQRTAIENYPLIKGKQLLLYANKAKIESLNTNYLPRLNLNSQATYQSEVTKISLDIPGVQVPAPPKDRYDLNLDISQSLYDGGLTKKQTRAEQDILSVDTLKIDVDLYTLKEKVSTIFFGILIHQENEKLVDMISVELGKKITMAESGVRNGILQASDLDLLKLEQLKNGQQKTEIRLQKYSLVEMLSRYINLAIPATTHFRKPIFTEEVVQNNRPELKLFDAQINSIGSSIEVLNSKRLPRIGAFAQTGYGQPGLNMLAENFNGYYLGGVRLTWNIFDWGHTNKGKLALMYNQQVISSQKESFTKNINIALVNQNASVDRLRHLVESDKAIIELQSGITKTFSSQLESGVISSSEYITQLIAEAQVRINHQIHEIQLLQELNNILFLTGN